MNDSLDSFFEEASVRVNTGAQNISQQLTQEEEEELREFALQRMQNMQAEQMVSVVPDYDSEMIDDPNREEDNNYEEVNEEEEYEYVEEHEEEHKDLDTALTVFMDAMENANQEKEKEVVEVPDYANIREEVTRFSDAKWFRKVQEQVVILAGIGGIGSNMAVILAKLNPRVLYLFDDDIVETVNMAGQFYSREDIGKYKTDAIAESIVKYTNYSAVYSCPRRYERGEEIVGDVMISGFDNMPARENFFEIWFEHVKTKPEEERKNCLLIDGRLTADEFQIFCMTGDDDYYIAQYKDKYLFNANEAEYTRCSFKQTGYLADMIGAFMVNLLVNHCANLSNPVRNMPLPFLTSYKADVMYLNTVK